MQKIKKSTTAKTRFELRLSAADSMRLEAIAARLGIPKSDVLKLALSAEPHHKNGESDKQAAAIAEALDALTSRTRALDDRMKNLEGLLDSAVDLLLSISRTAQRDATPTPPKNTPETTKQASPSWAEFQKKNPKLNPVMAQPEWLDFLRGRYEKTFGHPPDLSS